MMSDFKYSDTAPVVLVVSDRTDMRAEMTDDAISAGLRVRAECNVKDVLADQEKVQGTAMVLVDAHGLDDDVLDLLVILGGEQKRPLIIVTEIAFLDAVYSAVPHGNAHILVGRNRADRIVTLSRLARPVAQASEEPGSIDHAIELQDITE